MVRRIKHRRIKHRRRRSRSTKHGLPLRIAIAAVRFGAPKAKSAAIYGGRKIKEKVTRENIKKAAGAALSAYKRLKAIAKKKHGYGRHGRITMSIMRK